MIRLSKDETLPKKHRCQNYYVFWIYIEPIELIVKNERKMISLFIFYIEPIPDQCSAEKIPS